MTNALETPAASTGRWNRTDQVAAKLAGDAEAVHKRAGVPREDTEQTSTNAPRSTASATFRKIRSRLFKDLWVNCSVLTM